MSSSVLANNINFLSKKFEFQVEESFEKINYFLNNYCLQTEQVKHSIDSLKNTRAEVTRAIAKNIEINLDLTTSPKLTV